MLGAGERDNQKTKGDMRQQVTASSDDDDDSSCSDGLLLSLNPR